MLVTSLAIIGTACIGIFVSMIVFGYLKKGYAVGWKMYSIFF